MRIHTCQQCGVTFESKTHVRNYCDAHKLGHNRQHGLTFTPEHRIWRDMHRRCYSPQRHNYPRYGGRGIKICERWHKFENFLEDMGLRPDPKLTIERIDNDGNYESSNCKWASRLEQTRNRSGAYTPEEDAGIKEGISLGYCFRQIAAHLGTGRTHKSVMKRTYTIGLKSGRPPDPPKYRTHTAVSSQERNTP